LLAPNEAGFVAKCPESAKYGYFGLPNPRISEQPSRVLFPDFDRDDAVAFYIGRGKSHLEGGAATPIELPDGTVAVRYDISKPLTPQLKAAEAWLKRTQKRLRGKDLIRRRQPRKWVTYLRVLDAVADAVGPSEIAEVVLPQEKGDRSLQAVRDVCEQARELCFKF